MLKLSWRPTPKSQRAVCRWCVHMLRQRVRLHPASNANESRKVNLEPDPAAPPKSPAVSPPKSNADLASTKCSGSEVGSGSWLNSEMESWQDVNGMGSGKQLSESCEVKGIGARHLSKKPSSSKRYSRETNSKLLSPSTAAKMRVLLTQK